jgi:hypothetical protein
MSRIRRVLSAFVVSASAAAAIVACAAIFAAGACGTSDDAVSVVDDGGGDVADRPSDPDVAIDGSKRAYRLAATGGRLAVKGPKTGIELGSADLGSDVDLFAIHQDFHGVPWEEFESGTAPPAPWVATIDGLVRGAKLAGKGVFLSLTPISSGRDRLAPRVAADGSTVESSARCYDFRSAPDGATKRDAYVRYVEWMIARFQPAYLAVGIEVNLYDENCPSAWEGLVDVLDAAYDAAKTKQPAMVVFSTVENGHLLGYAKESCPDQNKRETCFETAYARLARLSRDRFAISTYPFGQGFAASDVPADWFSRAGAKKGERTSLDRDQRRSRLVLDEHHDELGRVGVAGVPADGVDVVGAFVEGLSGRQGDFLAAFHSHHDRSLEHIDKCVAIVTMDGVGSARRVLDRQHHRILPRDVW